MVYSIISDSYSKIVHNRERPDHRTNPTMLKLQYTLLSVSKLSQEVHDLLLDESGDAMQSN